MSWIFSFLLACYLLVRVVLRVRGQLRWLAIRDTLPVPPPPVEAPGHLPPALGGLFVDSRALRVALVEARRTLTAVEITDPDAPLGRVRDARYRRALMQSFTRINAWLRAARGLDEHAAARLADTHLGTEAIEHLRDRLARPWREVSRARALDPFELEDVLAVRRTLERIEVELEMIERGLERLGEHPYRDRLVEVAAAG